MLSRCANPDCGAPFESRAWTVLPFPPEFGTSPCFPIRIPFNITGCVIHARKPTRSIIARRLEYCFRFV